MAIGLLGRKVGMTQIYDDAGNVVPVTVLEAGPCHVLQVRTQDNDGYEAVQLGFKDKPRRLASRSERGHVARLESKRSKRRSAASSSGDKSSGDKGGVAKADCEPKQFIREFRASSSEAEVGQQLTVEQFAEIKSVDVIGTSKGRGTSGVMKRHNYSGQRATHGVKKCHRHAGSTGCSAFPSRTIKGRRMAGRYGAEKSTSRNLKVVRVDGENNLLLVRGAVPGPNGGFVVIRTTNML